MQQNYYEYSNDKLNILIGKTPIWFKEVSTEGDKENGKVFLESHDEFDEAFGKSVKIELSWEKKDRSEYFHAREVQTSIDLYNSINIVASKKETKWLLSHELTYWFGDRTKLIRRKYYASNIIHGLFYCELTERYFQIHIEVIKKFLPNYETFILEMLQSITCH